MRTMSGTLWMVVLLTAVLGAGSPARGDEPDEPAESDPVESEPMEPIDPSMTGAVSEEEFQDLHELKEGEAPELRGTTVEIAGTKAYLSLPPGREAPLPAVLVIHEWWGLNDHIRHWADRLALEGYAALALDLYGGKVATTPKEAQALMKAVDDAKAIETMRAGHAFLKDDERVQASGRAVLGWCFGGRKALQAGMHLDGLDAVVMYYGHLVFEVEALKGIDAPLLGIFGNQDESIPPKDVNRFDEALKKAGVEATILRYDAPHAFANPSSARYVQAAAAAAWAKARAFLAERVAGALEEAGEADEKLAERVRAVVAKVAGVAAVVVKNETTFEVLKLEPARVRDALEKEFGVDVAEAETEWISVAEAIAAVRAAPKTDAGASTKPDAPEKPDAPRRPDAPRPPTAPR